MHLVRLREWAKKPLIIVGLVVFIALAFITYKITHTPNRVPKYSNMVSGQQLSSNQTKQAAKLIKQKDYKAAQLSYLSAASIASSDKDNQKAIDILTEATKNIPDQYTTWQLYDTLSVLANKQSNKSLEISSLKKALTKAQLPNSKAPPLLLNIYNQRLKELGAT